MKTVNSFLNKLLITGLCLFATIYLLNLSPLRLDLVVDMLTLLLIAVFGMNVISFIVSLIIDPKIVTGPLRALFNKTGAAAQSKTVLFIFFGLAVIYVWLHTEFKLPFPGLEVYMDALRLGLPILLLIFGLLAFLQVLAQVKQKKKFVCLSGLNLLLTGLFVAGFALFQYGSPLIFEKQYEVSEANQIMWLVNEQVVRQEFVSGQDKLGTIGVEFGVKEARLGNKNGEVVELEEPELDDLEELEFLPDDKELGFDEEAEEVIEPVKLEFRIKEKGADEWLAVNHYYFNEPKPFGHYPLGFLVIDDSAGKDYVFELEAVNAAAELLKEEADFKEGVLLSVDGQEIEPKLAAFVRVNNQGQVSFYERFVYGREDLAQDFRLVFNNFQSKVISTFASHEFVLFLIIHFLFTFGLVGGFSSKDNFKNYGGSLFLISLLLLLLNYYLTSHYQSPVLYKLIKWYLIFASATLGALLLRKNSERIADQIDSEIEKEKSLEKYRKDEFSKKYPLINKVPIFQQFFKWFYKEELKYSSGLIFIIGAGLVLRVQGIFQKSPWFDEGISMLVAQRIAEGLGHTLESGASYSRAWLYHEYLGIFARAFENLYGYGVWANIPFFVISCLIIYKLTKNLSKKSFALLSVLLFSFSWLAIAQFRMIRMYEAFLSFFLVSFYLLSALFFDFSKLSLKNENIIQNVWNFVLEHKYTLLLFIIFFYISYDTQILSGYLIASGGIASFLLLLLKRKANYLLTTLLFSVTWVFGAIYRYRANFAQYLIFQPRPSWVETLGERPFLSVWNRLIEHDHYYLILGLIILVLIVFFDKKIVNNNKILRYVQLAVFTFGYYAITALQGSGTLAIRYFYPFLPLSIVIFSVSLFHLQKISFLSKRNYFKKIVFISLLSMILFVSIESGLRESSSVTTHSSKLGVNNIQYREFFDKIVNESYSPNEHIFGGDNHITLMYYLHTGHRPQLTVSRNVSNQAAHNHYIGSEYIGYNDFKDRINKSADETIFFLYDGRWGQWQEGKEAIFYNPHKVIVQHNNMKLLRYN